MNADRFSFWPALCLSIGSAPRRVLNTLKSLTLFGVICTGATSTPIFHWESDNRFGFTVWFEDTISDPLGRDYTGETFRGEIISPSGLWMVYYGGAAFFPDEMSGEFGYGEEGAIVSGTYNGKRAFTFSTPGGYGSWMSGIPYSSADAIADWSEYDNYIGEYGITILSGDFNLPSTWRYSVGISVRNPYAEVPDQASSLWLVAAGVVSALALRRRQRS